MFRHPPASLGAFMGQRANDAPGHLYPITLAAREVLTYDHHLIGGVSISTMPAGVEECVAPPSLFSLEAARDRAPVLDAQNLFAPPQGAAEPLKGYHPHAAQMQGRSRAVSQGGTK